MYGDRRQPWHPSQRRTYSSSSAAPRSLGVGRYSFERLTPPLGTGYLGRVGASGSLVSTAEGIASGAIDPVSAIESAIPGISSLFSGADGGPNDPRVKLLAQAYQQAVAGLNIASPYPGTGLPYLQFWVADQPPHPAYSNAIAQKLIIAVQQRNPAAAAAAVPVSVGPAIDPSTGQPVASTYAGAGGGLSISPVMLLVIAGVAFLVLRK